ncbi:MAG: inosine-5'-monophosphate dehydrogenase [Candidatus Methanoperedens nitroreducens]|uniref:Inosine-5'-monophosphate dehydrogenase n=1 Tax=Candidatus Methanoperedens nitratireducens TaxID=1392998 RepID=A0A0P8A2V7_9EURY|nr:CBS domain-containing protein [Candidatus Methanoperedens sp. BLZ2]KAB2948304.1 MAG: CBS domain-containing protein [Candidatus Methanoperedens sp.]KPQ42428.1 MAG: inosine-5'-monophosphate dehydrogenase [Candidatus Methanoperedens sp. BLZ1]
MNKSGNNVIINNVIIAKQGRKGYMRNMAPIDFKSRISEKTGDIMSIASNEVITIPPTMSVIGAVKTMLNHGFRRIPVADAGTNHLKGIITSQDIVDFLGGGQRNLIVKNKFKGNLLAAVNGSISEIMETNVISLNVKDSLKDALDTMIKENIGGIPVTDGDGTVKAIVSERDFVFLLSGIITGKTVEGYMSKKVVTAPSDMSVGAAARSMINNGFRRLPVLRDNVLIGIITASDIMRFLGSGDIFDRLVTGNAREVFQVPVSTLVKRDIIFTKSDIDLGEAANVMLDKNVGSLPVLEDGELKGIITERDFVRAMAD